MKPTGVGKKQTAIAIMVVALITLSFCAFFIHAIKEHERTLIREMAWEKQQDISLLAGIIDTIAEGGGAVAYEDVLIYAVQETEKTFHNTFAQVFDSDLRPLTGLNPGVGGGKKHNPMDYPEFVEAVTHSDAGTLSYWYETAQAGRREVHITYRWVPTGTRNYLVAIGISKYTISEHMPQHVIYGAVLLLAFLAAFTWRFASLAIRQLPHSKE